MAQVPATSYESTSLGDVAEFTIPFPFLSRAEVFVTVDGAQSAFTWINDGLIQLPEIPELGAIVRRYRSTAAYVPLHQFSQGVPFLPRYVDRDFKQTLYAVQESVNDTAGTSALALDTAELALDTAQGALALVGERTQYMVLGPYGPGLHFQTTSQVFSYLGEFYAPGPDITLPYTTTGAGAGEIANFRSVGDAVLRDDLANATDPAKGAGMVTYIPNVPDAVARKVSDKLAESKSFFDFLTDPIRSAAYTLKLDTLDYTEELQAAADYASTTGVAIYFPEGRALHTGITFDNGTVFIGAGVRAVELMNTSLTSRSIDLPYLNDSDWKVDWGIHRMTISAKEKGGVEQRGLSLDNCRHGQLSDIRITGHGTNLWQRATWDCCFVDVGIDSGGFGFLVDVGPSTPGVPNTYINMRVRFNEYGIDVRTRGLGAAAFVGGCVESNTVAGVRIAGLENRAIALLGVNFEANELDYISGNSEDAGSGPSGVSFKSCQFNSRTASKPFAMSLVRGDAIALDACVFLGYTEVADLKSTFGNFNLAGNVGTTTFAKSSHVNTPIPLVGTIVGSRLAWSEMRSTGFVFCQEAQSLYALRSRRTSEQYERFSVRGDGLFAWHNFNTVTPDTEFGRKAANCAGVGDDDALRSGRGATAVRPSASTVGAGAMFYDTTLEKPIWSNGSVWKDAAGTVV